MSVNKTKRKALRAARRCAILWQPNPIVVAQFDALGAHVIHYRWHDAAHNGDGWREPFLTELAAWEDVLRFYEQAVGGESSDFSVTREVDISPAVPT